MIDVEIAELRQRIDALDADIIRLCRERVRVSRAIVDLRRRAGGPPMVPARELDIVERYRTALGPAGGELAALLLRAGRGPV